MRPTTKNLSGALSLGLSVLVIATLTGCRSSVSTGNSKLSTVEYGKSAAASSESQLAARRNLAEEQAVNPGVLKAWRLATMENDEEGAMKVLMELDKEHPNISTVQFMMGQVKEHFKKTDEALEHYRKAHVINQFSSMQTYKLAESLRKSGRAKESLKYYEKLESNLKTAVEKHDREILSSLLSSVRLGMTRSLVDTGDYDKAVDVVEKIKQSKTFNGSDGKSTRTDTIRLLEKIVKGDESNMKAKAILKELQR